MIGFFGRRLLQSIPTLILISLLLFFGMQAVPGGPLSAFAFRPGMSNAARNAIIHQWGLDQPVYVQYLQWVKSMLTGTWQFSFFMHPHFDGDRLYRSADHRAPRRDHRGVAALFLLRPGGDFLLLRGLLDAHLLARAHAAADLRRLHSDPAGRGHRRRPPHPGGVPDG